MKICYFFVSAALATIFPLNECLKSYDYGTDTCYNFCTYYAKSEHLGDKDESLEPIKNIRLSFDCEVGDAEMCNEEYESDQEYYDCLVRVGCLSAKKVPQISGKVPEFLWSAVQKYYQTVALPNVELQECQSCKDEYFADDFYACVYYNCQDKLKDNIKYLQFIRKSADCSKCYNRASDDTEFCMWTKCRSEIVNKEFLYKELNQENLTCTDCESIVFADDYYNCISLYCSRLWSQENLNQLTTINEDCEQCKNIQSDLYEDCANVACKEEILELGGSSELFNDKRINCGRLLDEAYQDCVSSEQSLIGIAWVLFGVLGAVFICAVIGWKSKEDSYRLIVS